ncbi:ATP-dependent zinc protease [Methylosoma difficile]
MTEILTEKPKLGWREWVALPELNIAQIKAKIDTGARSSALHAFSIDPYRKGHERWVMFAIHPVQKCDDIIIECHAPVKDRRVVSDSGGHRQRRYVIETPLQIGNSLIMVEMTLTNRDSMRFRMLLGRTAMKDRFIIDPAGSFLQGNSIVPR